MQFALKIGKSTKHIFFLLFSDEIKVDSWWRWLFWHCSYCFCKCDAPGPNSDRYWSLKPVISDIESNKVITGVRFVKKDRVIQIEIEESAAMPEGTVYNILQYQDRRPLPKLYNPNTIKNMH